ANLDAVEAQRKADDNLDHETPLSELFEDQIAAADMIVVNKADLLGEAEADALVGELKAEARGGVHVVRSEMGRLPVEVVLGMDAAAEDNMDGRDEGHHHHHHDVPDHYDDDDDHDHHHDHHHHDDWETFVVERAEIGDPAAFANQVASVIRDHDILRLKGFVAVTGKPMRLTLQAVGPRVDTYYDQPFGDAARLTRLVVIGQTGLDRAAIAQALQA
ncbi:MAG TPA: cobalamin biosynthesis protein CobW, partial [Rhodobacterales bacterium]|nr:cobalamin biosynthesis protein CobW [Rhodobacterales bacterium]